MTVGREIPKDQISDLRSVHLAIKVISVTVFLALDSDQSLSAQKAFESCTIISQLPKNSESFHPRCLAHENAASLEPPLDTTVHPKHLETQ